MDSARKHADDILDELEKRVQAEYSKATKDVEEKLSKHFSRFEEKDIAKQEALDAGEITQEEYNKWRTGQFLTGKKWTDLRDTLAEDLVNSQEIAKSITNGYMPEVYAVSHNYVVEKASDDLNMNITFSMYDKQTVENLMKHSDILPAPGKTMKGKIARGEAVRWEKGQIQSVTMQSILQGESIPNMSKRIAQTLGERNRANSIRYARTACTGAENKGRLDGMRSLEKDGIILHKQWTATGDDRTRQSHLDIDGESVPLDEDFSNGLQYPGDPGGSADEVWNCRCSMGTIVIGFRRDDGSISYVDYGEAGVGEDQHDKEIAAEKERRNAGEPQNHVVVNGADISGTWVRRPDQFDFEIEDVINAQGFDGLPRVVSAEEFDKAVSENSFIAQRVYSAPDKETLDAYQEQLYNGKWYIDCGEGGAIYGQGMYATAGLSGNVTEEMKDANRFYSTRFGNDRAVKTEEFTLLKDARIIGHSELNDDFMRARFNGETAIENIGSYGAVKGYDAIIVKGEGAFDTDEIIILNRTKLIIKGE